MGTHGRRGERVTRSAPHTHPRSRKAGEAPLTLGGVGRRVERQVERRLERLIERLVEHVQRQLVRASTLTSHGGATSVQNAEQANQTLHTVSKQ